MFVLEKKDKNTEKTHFAVCLLSTFRKQKYLDRIYQAATCKEKQMSSFQIIIINIFIFARMHEFFPNYLAQKPASAVALLG